MFNKISLGIIAYILNNLVVLLLVSWKTSSWKTSTDMTLQKNSDDIKNLKKANEKFVNKDDLKEIKETLKNIENNILEIFKNMPVK